MLARNRECVDVIEVAVERLGDDRQVKPVAVAVLDGMRDQRIPHEADGIRVRDSDRRPKHPRLVDPGDPGHLAVAVE